MISQVDIDDMREPITESSDASLEKDVFEASQVRPVLVDFWAPWCRPCLALAQVLERLAPEFDGRLRFVKVNADANPQAAQDFGVRSLPALAYVLNGQILAISAGGKTEAQLRSWLASLCGD